MKEKIEKILLTKQEIAQRVEKIGNSIARDYPDQTKELVLIGVLTGSIIFYADLVRAIPRNVLFDFISISSYGNSDTSSGNVKILKDTKQDIEGKDIIVVEDIIDTGLTIDFVKNLFLARKPASLKVCCLLDKPSRRKLDVNADYTGFTIEDEFVVGYGLDYADDYRNLSDIAVIKP